MGRAGDSPATVGDSPTGTAVRHVGKRPYPWARIVAPVPSGESPDGTGGSPVLPKNDFTNALSDAIRKCLFRIEVQLLDRFGHVLARDLSRLCQRIERRDDGAFGIHFEEPAEPFARVAAAKPVRAQRH